MAFAVGNVYLEAAACALLIAALGAAIFFWGRGICGDRRSDLIAGPAILAALCAILWAIAGGSAAFIGLLVAVFGVATVLLSAVARPGGALARRDVVAIGVGAVIIGICLCLFL